MELEPKNNKPGTPQGSGKSSKLIEKPEGASGTWWRKLIKLEGADKVEGWLQRLFMILLAFTLFLIGVVKLVGFARYSIIG